MLKSLTHIARLTRAGLTLARYDALFPAEIMRAAPAPARLMHAVLKALSFSTAKTGPRAVRLSHACARLGPSYIKLGQFLATRPDIVGADLSGDLSLLLDELPPFSMQEAEQTIEQETGCSVNELFESLSSSIAAASIAQVHKAQTREPVGVKSQQVAVKILRPGIEARFKKDLATYQWAARWFERINKTARRLKPVDIVDTLTASVEMEMDLRMEAAALSEMAANIAEDQGFRVPGIDWLRTTRRVLTTEWIDATPFKDIKALKALGHDLPELGVRLMQNFLRHAIRDGFFHADMHQGNLFVEQDGTIVAVDLGIMGRLSRKDRRFLLQILHGFVTRDYKRLAEVHIEAGYVPAGHSVGDFAQALRAIGEPIFGRDAGQISMAKLLTQLFQVTGRFNMETQPQLILLQKTMVVVEGVARTLDPAFNLWAAAEPVLHDQMTEQFGPKGMIEDFLEALRALRALGPQMPEIIERLVAQAANPAPRANATKPAPASRNAASLWRKSGIIALWLLAISALVLAVQA